MGMVWIRFGVKTVGVLGLIGLSSSMAFAQDSPEGEPQTVVPERRVFGELRGGVQSAVGVQAPILCGEISPHALVSIEACGGQVPAMASPNQFEFTHFRLEGNIPLLERSLKGTKVVALAQPGIGFGEIENGADAPGFLFGPARTQDQREAAGPEASLAAKVRLKGSSRVVLTAEVNTTVSWISAAPVVLGTDGPLLLSTVATVGIGF